MIVGLEQKNLTFYSVWVDKTSQVSSLGFVPVSSLVDYGRRVAVIVAAALLLIMGENGWASANVHNGGWGSTESKWSLLHQLGSHGEGRVPRPPVQADSLGASGPYGHNTLTGLYFALYSFNQSTGHILSPSTHEFVFLFQKFVFIKMHLQLFSAALFPHRAFQLPTLNDDTWRNIHISEERVCLLSSPHSRDHGWMFKPDSTFWDKTLIRATQYWTKRISEIVVAVFEWDRWSWRLKSI